MRIRITLILLEAFPQFAQIRAKKHSTENEEKESTLVLMDSWAAIADVLSEYQERIAKEGYLGSTSRQHTVMQILTDLKKLKSLLEEINALFLIKAHKFVKEINLEDFHNIKLVDKDADIQELLLIANTLITDYSSVIFDFLLLDRPILLYAYDLDDYSKTWGFYYNLEEIAPGPIFYNAEDLINGIKNLDKIDKEYREKRIEIRNIFNKYIDGKSIERILNFLNIKFNQK